MADDLVIESAVLSKPRLSRPLIYDGSRQTWYDAIVTVRNTSAGPVFAVASLRNMRYDAETRTLTLRLAETEPASDEQSITRHVVRPHLVEVEAGARAQIRVQVPLVINRLVPSAGLGHGVEAIDIAEATTIDCTVAHAGQPFEVRPSETHPAFRLRHAAWGTTARHVGPITVAPMKRASDVTGGEP